MPENKQTYPPRPYIPVLFLIMVVVVAFFNLTLKDIIHIDFVQKGLSEKKEEMRNVSISTLLFEIESDASKTSSSCLCQAKTKLPSGKTVRVWLRSQEAYSYGHVLSCYGRFLANEDDDWGRSNDSQGIVGTVSIYKVIQIDNPRGLGAILVMFRELVLGALRPVRAKPAHFLRALLLPIELLLKNLSLMIYLLAQASRILLLCLGHI